MMKFSHFEFDPERDRLGEGPQSEVFRATDTRLGRTVALKILRPHVEFDPAAKERFEREAKHTSNLAHPNIATVYDYGQDRGTSYIVMEFLEGRTLDQIVKDRPLGYEEGMRIATQVTSAMGLVHERGLIHRDLKPANIMVQEDSTVKLLDFGICRSTQESSITQNGMLVGTVLYMSPEQVLGDELDSRTDVWALGAVFYLAFTGELAFPGRSFPEVCMAILEAKPKPPREIRTGFPPALSEFLLKCLERDRDKRYANGNEMHGALLAVAEGMRMQTESEQPTTIRGRVLIPPIAVGGDGRSDFAGGLRKDLASELERSTKLEVALLETDELPAECENAFVVRSKLDLEDGRATLTYVLERLEQNGKNSRNTTTELFRESIEHTDTDEWGLQGKLVGSLARSVRKKLSEVALSGPVVKKRDPARAENFSRRAHELLHRGTSRHLMSAISTFRRAVEADSTLAIAHAGMAEALVRKFLYWDGDRSFLAEAREEARHALALDSRCAEAHTSLGFAHALTGNSAEAVREYRVAIEIDHDEWLAHRLLGALLGRLGNFKDASPLLRRAIALRPTHIGSYDHLYNILCGLDRYPEALEIGERGIWLAKGRLREVPDDQEARLHLGLLLARMGSKDEARQQIREALEIAPKDAFTRFHCGCIEALLGDVEQALKSLKEGQMRGFFLQSELLRNSDLDILRGRPEFQMLLG